jgi:4-amino-4-deoxy-L-arabinose transferase-like glycosyltransferase
MDLRRAVRSRAAVVFVVALAARLLLWASFAFVDASRSLEGDGGGYYTLSRNLSTAYGGSRSDLSELALHRPPMYPTVVGALLAVGRNLKWALFFQCFVGAAVAVVTYYLARRVLSKNWAMVAGLVVAVDPVSVIHSNLLLTETLFAGLIAGAASLLLRTIERPTLAVAAAAGAVLGVATLTRPVSLYLPILLVPLLLWRIKGQLKLRGLCVVVLVAAFLVPVGSWAVRNRVVEGGLVVTTIDSYTMLHYRGRGALGAAIGMNRARERVAAIEAAYPPGLSAYEVAQRQFSDGFSMMVDHPKGAAEEYVKGFARTWTGPGTGQLAKLVPAADSHAVDLLLFIPLFLFLALAVLGVGRVWRTNRDAFWLLACLIGYLALLSASTETYARFRVPMVPLVAVFVAAGAASVASRLRGRRSDATDIAGPDTAEPAPVSV